jgi:CTP synthase (UTP-ammonia lyase)
VLGVENAEHEEVAPAASNPIISKLNCSIAGTTQRVQIIQDTLAFQIYQAEEAMEIFNCNYGLNSGYRNHLTRGEIRVSGTDSNGEVRIVELMGHRFFIATLFLPQASSNIGKPHPLIKTYLKAAMDFHDKMIKG